MTVMTVMTATGSAFSISDAPRWSRLSGVLVTPCGQHAGAGAPCATLKTNSVVPDGIPG